MTIRRLLAALLLLALTAGAGWAFQQARRSPAPKPAAKAVSYKTDVAPVMKKYCLPCHTEDSMNPSELYLDTHENILSGGKHGKSVLPGNPDGSLLVQKIALKPPFGDPMPLKLKAPFPADTLKILRDWIQQGAKNN